MLLTLEPDWVVEIRQRIAVSNGPPCRVGVGEIRDNAVPRRYEIQDDETATQYGNCRPQENSLYRAHKITMVSPRPSGMTSTAVTCAPPRAAQRATRPEPQPTSRKDLPARSSEETKRAEMELEPKYRGWKTVGKTVSVKPSTRVDTVFCDRSFNQYLNTSGCNARRMRPHDNMGAYYAPCWASASWESVQPIRF